MTHAWLSSFCNYMYDVIQNVMYISSVTFHNNWNSTMWWIYERLVQPLNHSTPVANSWSRFTRNTVNVCIAIEYDIMNKTFLPQPFSGAKSGEQMYITIIYTRIVGQQQFSLGKWGRWEWLRICGVWDGENGGHQCSLLGMMMKKTSQPASQHDDPNNRFPPKWPADPSDDDDMRQKENNAQQQTYTHSKVLHSWARMI